MRINVISYFPPLGACDNKNKAKQNKTKQKYVTTLKRQSYLLKLLILIFKMMHHNHIRLWSGLMSVVN